MIDKIIAGADSVISKFIPDKTKQIEFKTELSKYILEDKKSARDLHRLRLQSTDPFIRRFVPFLAIGVVSLCVIITTLLFFVEIPEKNKALLDFALGSLLTGGFGLVLGFYFGSSEK